MESYWIPIDPADLRTIAAAIRQADAFTPTFAASDVDCYDPAIYLQQAHRFQTSTRLVIDRNLLTRWVAVVRGIQPTSAHRLAAGILTFAQCANIVVEPNIALYEVARTMGGDAARSELHAFRIADGIHPGYWADLALGHADSVPIPSSIAVPITDLSVDFSIWLRRWRRNYIVALKLAELELSGGSSVRRMSSLLSWMHRDFLMSGPALILAAVYLAPNAPRKRLLKGLRSANREVALEGIRNATWDLTLVSEWAAAISRQEPDACLTLLGSLDRTVHFIARHVADLSTGAETPDTRVKDFLVSLWGESAGAQLSADWQSYYVARDSPMRQVNKPAPAAFVDECIATGEERVREWSLSRRNA